MARNSSGLATDPVNACMYLDAAETWEAPSDSASLSSSFGPSLSPSLSLSVSLSLSALSLSPLSLPSLPLPLSLSPSVYLSLSLSLSFSVSLTISLSLSLSLALLAYLQCTRLVFTTVIFCCLCLSSALPLPSSAWARRSLPGHAPCSSRHVAFLQAFLEPLQMYKQALIGQATA